MSYEGAGRKGLRPSGALPRSATVLMTARGTALALGLLLLSGGACSALGGMSGCVTRVEGGVRQPTLCVH